MHKYRAYGLVIESDIALPVPQEAEGEPDLVIAEGAIADDTGGANRFRNWEAEPGRFLGHFPPTGSVLIVEGQRVTYRRNGDADDTYIVSILLGTCLAAALMQRRILPLHSCSVLTEKGVVLVMGPSGAGKSTTLGGLLELGLPMLADDVTGLVIGDDGLPVAIPGFPAMRLWQDTLATLGHDTAGLPRVRSDLAKFYLPVDNFHNRPAPICGAIFIAPGNGSQMEIASLDPHLRVPTLSRFIFRKNFIDGMELRRFAFETVGAAARSIPMLRVVRPVQPVAPRDVASAILDALDQCEALV